ncbi:MAG: acyl-CoA thioesterase [Methanobrevibacter sp.]|jgi:acyl-CoA thioester hydrolase|nr:acyl-CoA thioesterase [Candidatus Methanovirga basalitermitum]
MFKIKIIPKFGDLDGLKHITNTILADWFETGRNDIFKLFTPDFDLSYEKWKLIMARTTYDFVGQMYLGRDVEIRTFILEIGNSSFTIGHEAYQDGELKVKGEAICVYFDFIEQKSKPIPNDIRKKLEEHLV